jgi:hypothetical protein
MSLHKRKLNDFFNFVNIVPKRIRIVGSLFIMTFLLLVSTFFDFTDWWLLFTLIFLLVSYFLTYISVFEEIDGIEWLMLFIMPMCFTIAFYVFFSLLPVRWLTRLPYITFFAFGYYAILLTSNIFNVGVEKSIQLYRAAFSVNYLFQTLIIFLFMQVILSFQQPIWVNCIAIAGAATIMAIQLFWSVNPISEFRKETVKFGGVIGFLLMQVAAIISFIPFKSSVGALILTACYYSLSGLIYHHLDQRLFKQVVREYVVVLVFVSIIAILTLQW